MEVQFEEPKFVHFKGKLTPSQHVVAHVVTGDDEREKWRCCLTLNDDGTWQWAPGPPEWMKIPPEITASISAMVKDRVAECGIAVTKGNA